MIAPELLEAFSDIKHELQSISAKLTTIDIILVKQQVILDNHIHRTEIAEAELSTQDQRVILLEKYVAAWSGAGKLVALIAILSAIGTSIYKFF